MKLQVWNKYILIITIGLALFLSSKNYMSIKAIDTESAQLMMSMSKGDAVEPKASSTEQDKDLLTQTIEKDLGEKLNGNWLFLKGSEAILIDGYRLGRWKSIEDITIQSLTIFEDKFQASIAVEAITGVENRIMEEGMAEVAAATPIIGIEDATRMMAETKEERLGVGVEEGKVGRETLLDRQGMTRGEADEMRLIYTYKVEGAFKNGVFQILTYRPYEDFKWTDETTQNVSWIKRLPYYNEVPEGLYEKIANDFTVWVEGNPSKLRQQTSIFDNPYKDNIQMIQVETCQVEAGVEDTKIHPIFNVCLKTKVLRNDYNTVYYNYKYQIGMQNEEILWIEFLNAHEID